MPRDVMPLMTDRDLSQQMTKSGSFGEGMGGPEPLVQPELSFSRQVIQSMVEGQGLTEPDPIALAGLYPGGDQMVNIDLLVNAPTGGFTQGRNVGIGSAIDPATVVHEIGGHSGLTGLRESGELGFDLSEVEGGGALERRLAAALPGTFSNQQFLTDKEARKALGLKPWEKMPDALYPLGDPSDPRTQWENLPFERSEGFEEQMPTAADWYDIQQRDNLEPLRDENGQLVLDKNGEVQWRNLGKPMRAGESFADMLVEDFINREATTKNEIEEDKDAVRAWRKSGDYHMGQNPFTQEHGGTDVLVGMQTDPADSIQARGAADRLGLYEGSVQGIVDMLHAFRDPKSEFYKGKDAEPILWGGEVFDDSWDDEDIYNYAVDQSIRMAPERALFGGNLSEGIVESIGEKVGGSEAHKKRLEYYKRDLGI